MSTTSKHTPGPWHVFHWHGQSTIIQNEVGQAIADTDLNKYIDKATKEANAKLIALAPEMVEALKSIKACADNGRLPPSKRIQIIFDLANVELYKLEKD